MHETRKHIFFVEEKTQKMVMSTQFGQNKYNSVVKVFIYFQLKEYYSFNGVNIHLGWNNTCNMF